MKISKKIVKLCLISALILNVSCSKDAKSSTRPIGETKDTQQIEDGDEKSNDTEDQAQQLANDLLLKQQLITETIQADLNEKINRMIEDKLSEISDFGDIDQQLNDEINNKFEQRQIELEADLSAQIEARIAKRVANLTDISDEQLELDAKIRDMQAKIAKKLNDKINADIEKALEKQSEDLNAEVEDKIEELKQRRMEVIVSSALIDKAQEGQISKDTQALITELTIAEAVKTTVRTKESQSEISKVASDINARNEKSLERNTIERMQQNMMKSLEAQTAKKMEELLCKQNLDCSQKD